jgi:hypothetical protein
MLHRPLFRHASARERDRGHPRAAGAAGLVLIATLIVPAAPALAVEPGDLVLQWNAAAFAAIGNAPTAATPGLGQVPPLAVIQLAIVQGAVYDAVNAIDKSHEPLIAGLSAPSSASQGAAAATAAHHVLVGLTPTALTQVVASLDAQYAASLASIPDGQAETDGIAVGAAAATAMLANRTGDGRFGSRTFVTGTAPGEWRLVAPANANVFAWVSDVRPFSLTSASQFRTEGPPALGSAQYATEYNEVKAVGRATGSTRTEDQAQLAAFVSNNGVPVFYRALREIAVDRHLSTAGQARLLAMTSVSGADAVIGCWESKVHWSFWRPQTAIQNGADDGNAATVADPEWTSLVGNPGYPDNPSGYNCITASTMHAARLFFGTDQISFTLNNPGSTPPTVRSYDRLTDVIDDAIDGRVLIGLHFRSADVQGAWLGKKVAQWVARHEFGPAE